MAAAHFHQRLLRLSGASVDHEYPASILVGEQIPSRIAHLLGRGPDPLPALLNAVAMLERAGADFIVVPSATTHAYYTALVSAARVPVCNLLAETSAECERRAYRRVLLLATEATRQLRLFEPYLSGRVRYPEFQRAIGCLIEQVKSGGPVEELRRELGHWIDSYDRDDVDGVVLGCTELSVVAPENTRLPTVDITEVLAHAALGRAGTIP